MFFNENSIHESVVAWERLAAFQARLASHCRQISRDAQKSVADIPLLAASLAALCLRERQGDITTLQDLGTFARFWDVSGLGVALAHAEKVGLVRITKSSAQGNRNAYYPTDSLKSLFFKRVTGAGSTLVQREMSET